MTRRAAVVGDWAWLVDSGQACKVVEVDDLWGTRVYHVWLPVEDLVIRTPEDRLRLLDEQDVASSSEHIAYVTAATRIVDALERDALVAPLEGTVIPLPHQIYALSRAMSGDRIRYLLADEVGLGKTIEAGLVLRELKIRGLIQRILVVAPTGLVTQWVSEMRTHFNEDFRLVIPGEFSTWRKIAAVDEGENLWRLHDQVICPLDSVKPMDSRRGWSAEKIARYNKERFEDLVTAGWDLIIIDESHRLGGSTEQVARYRLGEALAQAAPYLLLLTATPHQGKTDAFRRLLSFLDRDAFPDDDSVSQENVEPYVIRTEKRNAIDADGNPLFKPRRTQLVSVPWTDTHQDQRVLYDAVTEYVREGYNQARREKNTAIGFLMILFQRLVTSSVCAIRTSLERRLEVLELPQGQLSLFGEDVGEQWANLDSQEQMESILGSRMKGLKNERAEVELLLSAARQCEQKSPDIKAQALLDWIHKLQREENDPKLKVLVFTEFVPTQSMLAEFLGNRGYQVVCLNGSLNHDERHEVQRAFSDEAQVLISTDAGGEGLNLQFCHVVFNYDLPWNPMKLEQRIGRVDRIGQAHVVRAQNFALEDTVELRVREVLEEKLERILEEFGVDKLADVLDSEEGGVDFEDLYVSAVLTPEEAEKRAIELAERVHERAAASQQGSKVLGATTELDPSTAQKIAHHQLPYWTERMTISYLQTEGARGGEAEADDVGYRLQWPDGVTQRRAVFSRQESEQPGTTLLSLEHPRVRRLTARLPRFTPGQPLGSVVIEGISDKVSGIWSLWRIGLRTEGRYSHRAMPLFISDEGRVLAPTAKAVWDRLIDLDGDAVGIAHEAIGGETSSTVFEQAYKEAAKHGHTVFTELLASHEQRQIQQRNKGRRAFESRRIAIDRIGLPQVRNHRIRELEKEEVEWKDRIAAQDLALPELTALILVRVARSEDAE
jgi:superfamily II DNA or RNA helicase